MGVSIAKGISKPLVALENRLSTFAQGNLHDPFPEVKSNDEVASIAATSTKMAETLNAVITDVGVLMEGMAMVITPFSPSIPTNMSVTSNSY